MQQNTDSSTSAPPLRPWVGLLWMFITTLGLLLLSEACRVVPCWLIPLMVVVPAYPEIAAKKGGGALAGALGGAAFCSPAGPVAIGCGIVAGVVTWLAVDKVAIEIDETVSRDAMRADILAVLAEEKANLKTALQQRQASLIGNLTQDLRTTVDGVFIPARDGL